MFRPTSVAPPVTTRRSSNEHATDTAGDPVRPSAAVKPPAAELGPIIKSKIQPPVLRPTTLTRQRLIDQLQEATTHRLTLLIAEAGYGKTTLLADFARLSGVRTMWYRLDETDADIVDLVTYVIAAAREIDDEFGQSTVELIREIPTSGPPRQAFVSSLISELTELPAIPTVVVFDDFQAVDQSSDALDLIGRLARDAPPWLRLLVASRTRPDLELGRLAMSDDVVELHTDDLRFSADETRELFSRGFGISLDEDVLGVLGSRTMGWAASLQLFYGSIRGRTPSEIRTLVRSLSGAASPVYDFLAQEVLASVEVDLRRFLMRASLLEHISPLAVSALLADWVPPPGTAEARELIEDADRLGFLTSSSTSSDAREMHPLLRDFFAKELLQLEGLNAIQEMNFRVACTLSSVDPLDAAHYFAQSGRQAEAMQAIDRSLVETIGSGRWGMAARLVGGLTGVEASPAASAIRARQLMEEGDLVGAAGLLQAANVEEAPPDVRAVFRQTSLSLGWRLGDRRRMLADLQAIDGDPDTPPILGDIAHVLLEASSFVSSPTPLPELGRRLERMSAVMGSERLTLYSAIALHDSALAYLNAGELDRAQAVGAQALERFSGLTFFAVEQLSTHTALSVCEAELGHRLNAEAHRHAALASGREMVDVPAELARLSLVLGDTAQSTELIDRARFLKRQNQTDAIGNALLDCAVAVGEFRTNLPLSIELLKGANFDTPMELGYSLERDVLLAQALLLAARDEEAHELITTALRQARTRGARRSELRLDVLSAIAQRDKSQFEAAIATASRSSALVALELSDVVISRIALLSPIADAIKESIASHPQRWLPAIRRRLDDGGTPEARISASLLDEFGTIEDVGRVRAFAKTYVKKGPSRSLGKALARRTSPLLTIRDLGPTTLQIDGREVRVTDIRRKSAAVLTYLITRPRFSANRDQAIDALWPDADPDSAVNNLNQALFFLRRRIDPWYEDDLSVEYIELQGDLVWLDDRLVRADSVNFLQRSINRHSDAHNLADLVLSYPGRFAPEFEYEEWAIPWRGRVHAAFLDVAHTVCDALIGIGELPRARDVAAHVLRVDDSATDVEIKLVWVYGRMGLTSAAQSLYERLRRQEEAEGITVMPLADLLARASPP